jgi:hypothetical protein
MKIEISTPRLVEEIDKFLDIYSNQTKNLWSIYVANHLILKELVVGDILQTDYKIVTFTTNVIIFHCKVIHNIHGDTQFNTITKQLNQIQPLFDYLKKMNSEQENINYYQENKI